MATERTKSTSRAPIWGRPALLHCRCVSPGISEQTREPTALSAGLPFLVMLSLPTPAYLGGLARLPSHTKSTSRSRISVTSLNTMQSYMFIKWEIKDLPQIIFSLTHHPQILSLSQSCGIQPNNNGSFAQKYILLYLLVTFFLTSPLCQFLLTISSPPF